MKKIFERKITKRLLSITADQLLHYLSHDKMRRFLASKLLSSNSVEALSIIDAVGKKDISEGWIKQEHILRFLSEISSTAKTECFYNDLTSFFRNFWDNFAGCFGIDSGSESERYIRSKKVLDSILAIACKDERKKVILNIFNSLKKATYLASGANRYVPLAIFVINLFHNNSVYSVKYLHDSKILKLLRNHLFYNKEAQYGEIKYERNMFFPKLPNIVLDAPNYIHDNTKIQWLDIGCAPKAYGCPTLSLLKNTFKQCSLFQKKNITFKFTGTDVYFPYYFYKTSTKEINVHKVFSAFRHGVKKIEYDDIIYLNANYRINNADNTTFVGGREKEYHFISACKVMHHFVKNKPIKLLQLAERIKVDNQYRSISWDTNNAKGYLSKSQQQVIENLLHLLKIGGFLFLDLSNPYPNNFKPINQNFFLVIQRLSDTKIKLHNFVIPYDPDDKKVYPHAEYILRDQDYIFNKFCGARKGTKNKREFAKDYKQLKSIMRQLDIFVYYLQSKDNIPNQNLHLASEAFKNGAKLIDACKIYLKGIYANKESASLTSQNKKFHRTLTQTLKQIETIENKYRKPSQNIVNVMMIGCGGAARDSYIPGIINVSNVNLASIVIPGGIQNKRDAITQIKFTAQNFSSNNFKDFITKYVRQITQLSKGKKILDYDKDWLDIETILDQELLTKNINAIIIGSPEGFHHKYIEWALKHRLHIACDKPLTSRIGITTDPLGKTSPQNKIALATELINDYHKYIEILNKINLESLQELQFEILTKKRYSKVVKSINSELHKSPAKFIQIFTADGWWLTPAQLARTDIFTMYGMHGNKSDGGKLVHTAAHFLDLAIMFAREGRAFTEHEHDIVSADITVCFIRGYDSVIRSNNKAWLDIEASSVNIIDQNEIHIQLKKYFNTIKKLPEINLSLQIKLTFSNNDVAYIQLMGLHENLAKMANKSADYKQRFQSRTKVDHIFILQNNGNKIEYRRLSKVTPNATGKNIANNKQHELYIGKKKIELPFEEDIDTKPVIRFLENIKLNQSNSLKPTKVLSYSNLIRHEYDVKILAAIYKRIAEHYIESIGNKSLFKLDRQLYFKYLFNEQANYLTASESTDSNIPYFKITKLNHLDKALFNKVEEIKNITKYGIISIQCITFGGIFGKQTKNSVGFSYLDDLIALVQFSYEDIPDEKLIDWQISLRKEPKLNMLTAQIIFYGQKNNYKYIACQLQLFAININKKRDKLGTYSQPFIHSLSIAQSPFALTLARGSEKTSKLNLQNFYSKELLNQIIIDK